MRTGEPKKLKADKRLRTDLDLFVLALVNRGMRTPYDLKVDAGISRGASIPVLNRLLEQNLVTAGAPTERSRSEYSLTGRAKAICGSAVGVC